MTLFEAAGVSFSDVVTVKLSVPVPTGALAVNVDLHLAVSAGAARAVQVDRYPYGGVGAPVSAGLSARASDEVDIRGSRAQGRRRA